MKKEKRYYQDRSDKCLHKAIITSILFPGTGIGFAFMWAAAAFGAADVYYNPEAYEGTMEQIFKKGADIKIEKGQ